MVFQRLICLYRICSGGKVIPLFQCSPKWTAWQKCSKSCGAWQTTRRLNCLLNPLIRGVDKRILIKGDSETCLNRIEVKPCFQRPCHGKFFYVCALVISVSQSCVNLHNGQTGVRVISDLVKLNTRPVCGKWSMIIRRHPARNP